MCYGFPVSTRCALLILAAVVVAAGCAPTKSGGGEQAAQPLEVEEISLPVDSALSTEADRKGPPVVQGVAGVLPSDFPRDVTVHTPSSVSDFGDTADGSRFVELESPTAVAAVTASFEQRLRGQGWVVRRSGADALQVSKNGRAVTITISQLDSGSRIRVEYR